MQEGLEEVTLADVEAVHYVGLTMRGKPLLFCGGYSYIHDKKGRNGVVYSSKLEVLASKGQVSR